MKKGDLIKGKKRLFVAVFGLFVVGVLVVFLVANKAEGSIKEIGDYVYSDEVKIKTGSDDNQFDTISGYSGFDWGAIESIMGANKDRLINEYARSYTEFSGFGNLNPDNKPEGQVWVINGDLNIDYDTVVNGKGTIIVNGGNLNITGNIEYGTAKSSIGFIVIKNDGYVCNNDGNNSSGAITINSDVSKLVGAYYSSCNITFK